MTIDLLTSPLLTSADLLVAEACRIMAPPPKLTVSEWADQRRVLGTSSAQPGQWRTAQAPYLREIMDAFSDPRVTEGTLAKSAQIGGSECANNVVGYFMDQDPSTIMYVCETEEKSQAWSKERLVQMIESTPCLRGKVQTGRGPASANTIGYKEFPGGCIISVGAGSDGALSSRAVRVLIKDELDKWLITKAGDPDTRADMRTTTYQGRKKIFNISTPLLHDPDPESPVKSRIMTKYAAGTMEKYHVPCPFCGHEQILRESQLKFTRPGNTGDKVDDAKYECEACKMQISHMHKRRMLAAGRWIAERPFAGHRSFWINALYSPWVTWKEYAEAFLRMKRQPDTYKTFVNEWRGEPWNEQMSVEKDISVYTARCESYDKVPLGAAILTAAVDVQANRLECEVRAWGVGRESWGMGHKIFTGDTAKLTTGHLPQVWLDLDIFLRQLWEHECGEMLRLSRVFIDMGYLQTEVWKFCKPRRGLGIFPSKGIGTVGTPLVSKRSVKTKDNIHYFPVGPNEAKETIFGNVDVSSDKSIDEDALRVKIASDWASDASLRADYRKRDEEFQHYLAHSLTNAYSTPGCMHFRKGHYDADYFKQLLISERKKYVKGVPIFEKVTTSSRNEALDLCVYNLAAFESMQVDPRPYVEALRRKYEAAKGAGEEGARREMKEEQKERKTGRRILSRGIEE